jgi:hypothetical protein
MKGRQLALMPGNEDKVGYWLTPPDLMKKLDEEFHFDFDACPYPRPAGFDGLKEEWGQRTWVNPPFTGGPGVTAWAKKAVEETRKGKTVVLILPLDRWIGYLFDQGVEMRPVGYVSWRNPNGRRRMQSSRYNFLFILRPHCSTANRM